MNSQKMRRAPAYIIVETSRFISDENLANIVRLIDEIIGNLRLDPYALETGWISILVIAAQPKQLIALTELTEIELMR